ncbi:terpene cyclase/mutase family protein [Streptomyces sp. LRE541]|uniref:prenyltransferase/squalene oxidase repeat-containing protein n=1 Tax=Streptomyces sp. LRE541 TaxID=2931983 RepID=UPI00200FC35C|nr:prenyltransferase/squalene oxidase repeat-containing protein [Streptomyces sp. LRE541]UPZ31503.1 terpene cyclase/mutase family protein [Streptomyces sp. LRE541]
MFVRRSAAVLAATAVIGTAFAPAAVADESPSASPSPSRTLPSGLYGSTDPTYDGVWRQSLALLAQHTVGVKPAAKAVDWLTGQQCANGGFAAYRADPATKCDARTQIDTNSTGAALQALTALDTGGAGAGEADAAVKWLKSVQNEDGGWGYLPGGASDTNSTSVVIGALEAADTDTRNLRSKDDRTPYDALLGLALPCGKGAGAGADDGGAFAFQPDKKGKLAANADATAAGVLGALGEGLVTDPEDDGRSAAPSGAAECAGGDSPTPAEAAANGAAYLVGAVAGTGHLESALAGADDQPDHGNTADTVVALAAAGRTADAGKPLAWLEKNSASWAAASGPAAYAQLIFAAHATGTDPRDFGGADLVKQLGATGPAAASSDPSAEGGQDTKDQDDNDRSEDDGGVSVWWIVGVGLVGGIGVGFLLSSRTKKQRQP